MVLDPGVGFAKRSEHSLRVLGDLRRVTALGFPVMVGVSRKRFIGELSGVEQPSERVFGTVGANVVVRPGNWDLALTVDVDDAAALEEYREHPEHQKVLRLINELVADRCAVDFAV